MSGNLRDPPISFSKKNQIVGETGRTKSWHIGRDLATEVSEITKHEKVSRAERNEAQETDRGSRSLSIVATESRETEPREPVSSQGKGRNTELPLGNTR